MTFNDYQDLDFEQGTMDDVVAHRLPAVREPRRTGLQSADPVLSTCVHEIARALEEFARKQYVSLLGTDIEFETAAIAIAEKLGAEKCPLRGA